MLVGFRKISEGGGKGNSLVDLVKRFADEQELTRCAIRRKQGGSLPGMGFC